MMFHLLEMEQLQTLLSMETFKPLMSMDPGESLQISLDGKVLELKLDITLHMELVAANNANSMVIVTTKLLNTLFLTINTTFFKILLLAVTPSQTETLHIPSHSIGQLEQLVQMTLLHLKLIFYGITLFLIH